MLDRDLAKIYGVPTFRFNEAIKRNRHRFPSDFMFRLTRKEFDTLKSQTTNSSQIAMSSAKHRGTEYRPYAFTEYGALQAANVLRSPRAVQMSVFVIRAFVKMRETRDLARKLAALEKQLTGRLNMHETAIVQVPKNSCRSSIHRPNRHPKNRRSVSAPDLRFNEAVKRNRERFPKDFMFRLTASEVAALTSQSAISKKGRGGRRTLPYVFTEHGAGGDEYDVRGRRWMDCIGRMVMRPSERRSRVKRPSSRFSNE